MEVVETIVADAAPVVDEELELDDSDEDTAPVCAPTTVEELFEVVDARVVALARVLLEVVVALANSVG